MSACLGKLTSLLLAVSGIAAADEITQKLDEEVSFDIPAQSLDSALLQLGQQAQLQLLFSASEFHGQQSRSLRGRTRTSSALSKLLDNTGLVYEPIGENTVAVRPADLEAERPLRLAQNQSSSGPTSAESRTKKTQDNSSQVNSLEEVVVTAQKREQRLKDVPISISVLGGDKLDSSTAEGITDAVNRVPGVATTLTWQGGGTQLAIRGVTAGGPLFNGSSPVAYYLDSVPFGFIKSAIAPDSNAYDLERVEVLRGPQGTLYGASAMNGVVRVLTKDADSNKFEFKGRAAGSATKGGGQNYRGDMAMNVPVVEGKLAARAVVGYEKLGGWIDRSNERDANDGELRNLRLKVNARPTDDLSVGLFGWISRSDYGAPSISADGERNASLMQEPMASDYDAYGLRIGYDFPAVSVASATSYVNYENDGNLDFLGSMLFTGLDSKVFAQEISLNSTDQGAWRWSLGGIYRDAEERLLQTWPGILVAPTDFSDSSKSFAAFGELTRLFLDGRLEFTVGLRHFEDEVEGQQNQPHTGIPTDPLIRTSDEFQADSPRVVLTWHPSSLSTVYASYAEGFRSGFNQNPNVLAGAPTFPPLDADTLKNYELGAKTALLDGRLSLDAAVFYIDWLDVQQTRAVEINGTPFFGFVNGDSASGVGVEFATTVLPIERLELGLNFSWNDLTWDSPVVSAGVLLFDSGERLNYSPEYTVGTSLDYELPLGGGGYLGSLAVAANYTSKQAFRTILQDARVVEFGDTMLLARASFSVESPDRWTATLYLDNATDERGTPISTPYGVADWSARVRPRTAGVQVEYRF